jgi:hypothetical protein
MAIKHLTYLDLTPEQRRDSARKARAQIQQQLANVLITPDQQQTLLTHLDKVNQWEAGTLAMGKPQTATPVSHSVSVNERVAVREK